MARKGLYHLKEGVIDGGRRVKKKRTIPILIAIIVVIFVVGVCGYFLLKKQGKEFEFIILIAIITVCGMISSLILQKIGKPEQTLYSLPGRP